MDDTQKKPDEQILVEDAVTVDSENTSSEVENPEETADATPTQE